NLSTGVEGLTRDLDRILLSMRHQSVKLPGQKLSSFFHLGFDGHLRHIHSFPTRRSSDLYQNPVRAGLVRCAEDWPYAGEVVRIEGTRTARLSASRLERSSCSKCAEDSAHYSRLSPAGSRLVASAVSADFGRAPKSPSLCA